MNDWSYEQAVVESEKRRIAEFSATLTAVMNGMPTADEYAHAWREVIQLQPTAQEYVDAWNAWSGSTQGGETLAALDLVLLHRQRPNRIQRLKRRLLRWYMSVS